MQISGKSRKAKGSIKKKPDVSMKHHRQIENRKGHRSRVTGELLPFPMALSKAESLTVGENDYRWNWEGPGIPTGTSPIEEIR